LDLGTFLKDYGLTVAWSIAIAGWTITNSQANTREKRKEFRSEIATIETSLKSLLERMDKYLRERERTDEAKRLELEIVVLFRALDLMHERLDKRQTGGKLGLYLDVVKRRREELYDLATGSYFETSARIPDSELHPRIQALHTKAYLLIESLHDLFLAKFDGIRTESVTGPCR
jgi:hypothetical protein